MSSVIFDCNKLTMLRNCDRTILPLRILAWISFCCAQNKKQTDNKDI